MRFRHVAWFFAFILLSSFAYGSNPQVTSTNPTSGPIGTQVQIIGTGFGSTQGTSVVSFGGQPPSIVSWSDTLITVTVPVTAVTSPVYVTVAGTTSNTTVYFNIPGPQVNSISPTSGAVGTQVTVNGTGFQATKGSNASVNFNGIAGTVVSWSNTQTVATVPANARSGPVTVTVNAVTSNEDVLFTMANPTVTGLTPASGPVGTSVQIAGSGFGATQGTSTLQFGSVTVTPATWSDTQITATVPTTAISGAVKITVGGVASSGNVDFSIPAPQVNSVTPNVGVANAQITVNGSGFQATKGSSLLAINGTNANTTTWSDTQIVATVPTSPVTGPVRVTVNGVASNLDVLFKVPNPTITALSPSGGPPGSQIQIAGTGFGTTQGSGTVYLAGYATIVSWSDTLIVATIPLTASSGRVQVTVSGISSTSNVTFTVTNPLVTSVSPTSGATGTQVTINGSSFGATQGASGAVTFNGKNATITSWSSTQIVATVPNSASTGPVKVFTGAGNSNPDVVFVMPNPIVSSISPSSGEPGTQVQINGSGFGATQGTGTLQFYSTITASIVSWSDTQITATVPSAALTGGVTVTCGGVPSNNNIAFTVPRPLITGISPSSGVVGTQITISGSGFEPTRGSSSVSLTSGATLTIVSWSDTQIVATIPAGAVTGDLYALVNNVQSNQDRLFTLPNPVITSFSPPGAPVGAQVQVNGSGFGANQGTNTITLNFVNMTVVNWADNLITATIPTGATTSGLRVTVGGVVSSATLTVGNVNLNSFTPTAGPVNTPVILNGNGFGGTQGTSTVLYNGAAITPTSWSDTQIVANVPTGSTSGPFGVKVGTTTLNTSAWFIVNNNVSIGSVSPASAPIGAQIQINGTGFGSTQGTGWVSIGQQSATIVSWSSTLITAVVPTSATINGGVAVTAGGSISNAATFTVISPKITSISPSSATAGTQVTISGSNFGTTQGFVNFPGVRGTIVSWADTAITATVPAGAQTGAVSLNAGGINSNGINFTVPGPIVTSISPTSGIVGTQVTINGSGFVSSQGSSFPTFYGYPAPVISWSDTQVVATVPAGAKTGSAAIDVSGSTQSNLDVVFSMPNPVITSLSPAVGPMDTVVQVNGNGFGATQGTSTLAFPSAFGGPGAVMATPLTWSDTAITVKVPATASTGALIVKVGGVVSTSTISFTVPPPQITSVSPARGTTGTQITITGSGFHATQGSGSLNYSNGQPSSSIVSWSDTQIVASIQSYGSNGGLYVTQNVSSNADVLFAFISPVITGISPTSGPVGTQVQINGSGFGATQGTSVANFLGAAGNIISWSDTQIVTTVPAAARSGQVSVTVGAVASNSNINYTVPSPQIASITPTSGTVGTTVTIAGSGFQSSTGGHLFFNGTVATVTSWNDTQIVAQVPAGATSGGISVTANNGAASNQDVLFTLPNPTVTAVVPGSGPGGTQVTVSGTGFGASHGSSTIAFGTSSASVISWSDTQIVALVPSTAGSSSPVQVTEGGVAGNTNVYFTVTSPTITSLSPTIGGGGNPVTITGTGFEATQGPSSQVIISGGGAAIRSWSDTQIVAIVPANATTGSARVYVNNSPSNYVTYTVPANMITGLNPTTGPVGTPVTVHGSGFGASQGTSVLSFNGQPAASITSWTDTQIVGTVPVTAASGPAIVAVNNINSNATNLFTVPPPFITSLTPQGGIAGTSVTINGIAFQATRRDSVIKFNGIPATVTSWSDSQIVATVPSGAATGQVQVTVNSVSTSGNSFEVPNPVIASISRSEAPAGGTITITGSGFGPSYRISPDGISTVYVGWIEVNGIAGGAISWSDTSITAQLPSNATTGTLTVVKYDTTSNGVPITIEGAPSVASLSPAVGPINASIVISGTGFGATQYDSTVQFSGISATITAWSDTQITATVPPGEYTGPVNVTVAGVTGPTQNFTLSTSAQITDSLGNSSSYTSVMLAGSWLSSDSTGSGCSTCTTRGTIHTDYDIYGNPTAETDELLHVTNYTYDANHHLASATAHLDPSTPVTTSYTYNSFGEPLTVTDPLGNVTTNTYDANGNLLTVTSPAPATGVAASVTQFAYDTKGQLTQITDPLSHSSTLTYYPTGLLHTITDAQSNVTSYEYDLRGNRTAVVDAQSNRTTFAYDLSNRLTGITYPDSAAVTFAYDARGRRTSVTDQNGKVTSYAYDDADRLTSVADAALNVTHYAYDLENNLTSITDAAGHTTSFVYDAFGRVTQTAFPSSLTENYVYDAIGNLTNKTDRKNQTILYVYDALNRLSHKGYPDATGVDYVYDLAGKIKQVTDPTGSYGFAYDNMGRLTGTSTQYSFLPGNTYTNAYGYDAASNRTGFTAPDGSTNTYAYDTLNRLSTLTDSGAGQFTMGYDSLSRRTQLMRPNGVTTSYGYDPVSHLQSILHKLGVDTLDGATYAYDLAGNRTSKTSQLNSTVSNYGYDDIYQLKGVTQGATNNEAYTFDPMGNRLSSLSVPSYTFNSSNQVTTAGSSSYTYDNNGNTLTKTDGSGTATYTWNFENRLTSVHPPSQATVTFKYDPFGRRILKGGSAYVYDGANMIEEVDAAGSLAARYVFGTSIDEPLAAYGGATLKFYQADGLGSITSLSSMTGTVSDSFAYDSFGSVTSSTGSFSQPFRYAGREWDTETELYYYRARYFDSSDGRFLSEDPLKFRGGDVNFYRYVYNNPVALIDPSGLGAKGAAIGGVIGGIAGGYLGCQLGGGLGAGAGAILGAPTGPGELVTIPAGAAAGCVAGIAAGGGGGVLAGSYIGSYVEDHANAIVGVLAATLAACARRADRWSCTASCNLQGIRSIVPAVDRVFGTGSGSSESEACINAKRSATQSAPPGTYARHCQCFCTKR